MMISSTNYEITARIKPEITGFQLVLLCSITNIAWERQHPLNNPFIFKCCSQISASRRALNCCIFILQLLINIQSYCQPLRALLALMVLTWDPAPRVSEPHFSLVMPYPDPPWCCRCACVQPHLWPWLCGELISWTGPSALFFLQPHL